MDTKPGRLASMGLTLAAITAAAGCAGREARDFDGRWFPANRYAVATEAIPLAGASVYQATPIDGTLRNLLVRWARDSGSELDYRHPFDFTLHESVRDVRSGDLRGALAQLEQAFDGQGLGLWLEGDRLVVAARDAAGG